MLRIIGRNRDRKAESVAIACFCQQFFRFVHIIAVFVCQFRLKVFPEIREHAAADFYALAIGNHIDDLIAVDAVAQRLSHLFILERFKTVV